MPWQGRAQSPLKLIICLNCILIDNSQDSVLYKELRVTGEGKGDWKLEDKEKEIIVDAFHVRRRKRGNLR